LATARSISSGVVTSGRVTSSDSGTATSRAFLSVNSTAAATAPDASSSTPSMRDWFTIVATSSSVKVDAASSFGSTRNRRTMWFAIQFSATMSG